MDEEEDAAAGWSPFEDRDSSVVVDASAKRILPRLVDLTVAGAEDGSRKDGERDACCWDRTVAEESCIRTSSVDCAGAASPPAPMLSTEMVSGACCALI